MKTLCLFPTLVLLLSCNQNTDAGRKKINVIGQAKMKVVPDMVELSLIGYTVKPAMKDAVAETQKAVNEILAVCNRYVVNPSDIKVSNISTDKEYVSVGNSDRFAGYSARQVLDVTLKDITKIEQFTEELLATKISAIQSIQYNHTKADSIMREVSLMALEDARKTAEKMCSKMNTSVGSILYLSNYENNESSNERGMRYSGSGYDMNLYGKGFGGKGFKMTAEILEFHDVAYAGFELK